MAEAIAMRHYVQVAVQAGYSLLVLKGDNQVIIKTLKGEIQVSWELHALIEDTKVYLNSYIIVYLAHFQRRESNSRLVGQI